MIVRDGTYHADPTPGLAAAGVGVLTWRRLAAQRAGHRSLVSRVRRAVRS